MKDLISIIIPTYNRAHLINETLDSVLAQTYSNWECLVIDDGGRDHTEMIVRDYCKRDKRIKYYKRPNSYPKGGNGARNYGFNLTKGIFVNWFDDDDLMYSNKLQVQLDILKKESSNYVVSNVLVFEGQIENSLGLRHNNLISSTPLIDYIKLEIFWITSSVLWRKAFLLKFDYLFDLDLKAAQEWEFHLRAINRDQKYSHTNLPLVYLRKHEHSITYNNNEVKRLYNYFLARLKVYEHLSLNMETKAYLRKFMLDSFKSIVKSGQAQYAFKAFKNFILKDRKINFKSKRYAFFAILSFSVLKKGNLFLKKVTL